MARYGRNGRPDYGHRWRLLVARVKRNQGVCWICGGEIDLDLKSPHPWSFTVDHLEPVKFRPELALVYENLRAAHRRCNASRGLGRHRRPVRKNAPSREW